MMLLVLTLPQRTEAKLEPLSKASRDQLAQHSLIQKAK